MPVHWTDFPTRVEKFGDLFNIFETLDRDVTARVLHSGCFANESDDSAYEVELLGAPYRFIPRAGRIPGWDELATFTERHLKQPVSLVCLRFVRSMAMEAFDATIADVNEKSIVEVVAALDAAARRPEGAEGDFLLNEYRFLKVGQIAKLFDLSPSRVTKFTDAGTFTSNGKTGNDRRVDVLSVVRWTLTQVGELGGAGARTPD